MNGLEATFWAVVDASWRASFLILAVLALRPLLRGRLSARVLFWAWIAIALRLLIPFALPAAWSPFNLADLPHPRGSAASAGPALGTTPTSPAEPSPAAGSELDTRPDERPSRIGTLSPSRLAALAWAAGVAALGLVRLCAYGRFLRRFRSSRAEPSARLAPLLAAAARFGGSRGINAFITDTVRAPALQGVFRPKLLFPPGLLERLTPREVQVIVAHELAHDRRRDLLVQASIQAAAILHWFNPLAWVASRIAREDCELACDESVLSGPSASDPQLYGDTLLKLATLAKTETPPPLGVGVVESTPRIKRRITMIVANQPSSLPRAVAGYALISIVTGLSLTREAGAQPTVAAASPGVTAAPRPAQAAQPGSADAGDRALTDDLDAMFPDGVVTTVGGTVITVEQVRREIKPLLQQVSDGALKADDVDQVLYQIQNNAIQRLISRRLLINEFYAHKPGGEGRHIPAKFVDDRIDEIVNQEFGDDRSKFLASLRSRGETLSHYREGLEEDIAYRYMKNQQARLEQEVHLRMITLSRTGTDTDATLLAKANSIVARLNRGEKFAELAREFSTDQRASRGGDWGWQKFFDLKPQFSDPLFVLKTGQVTAPILTKEGCFLLYAEDRK
jgi:peptidyl-prolyl cis-trans isomerase SurA